MRQVSYIKAQPEASYFSIEAKHLKQIKELELMAAKQIIIVSKKTVK